MRIHLPEETINLLADAIASKITIRTWTGGTSHDVTTTPTAAQRKTVKNVAKGALLGLRWGEDTRANVGGREQAIIEAVEFILLCSLPDVNSYDTIYNPLLAVTEIWRLASEHTWRGSRTDWAARLFRDRFPAWCDVIGSNFEYCQDEDWTPLNLEDAKVQLDGMQESGMLESIPEAQQDAGMLYLVWNMHVLEHLKGGN